jgi:hypothetical protein
MALRLFSQQSERKEYGSDMRRVASLLGVLRVSAGPRAVPSSGFWSEGPTPRGAKRSSTSHLGGRVAEPGVPGFGSLQECVEREPAELAIFCCGLGV